MTKGSKIAIGALATALLAWGAHATMGANFINGLQKKAETTLVAGAMDGVDVKFITDPALQRVAILSGNKTPEEREAALKAVRALPGVFDARWADDGAATADTGAVTPATKEAVANCQKDIDAKMTGKTILFKSGSAYIAPESNKLIDEIAAELKACAGTAVAVEGHTDATGNAQVNQSLSQSRADAVAAALIQRGLDKANVSAKGFGSSQPKAAGTDAAANDANRRTEFKISAAGAAAPAAEAAEQPAAPAAGAAAQPAADAAAKEGK